MIYSETRLDDGEIRGAEISECGRFRYRLWRRWAAGPSVLFVMLNPSTADAALDDPTVRKCRGFARRMGAGAIEVVNLYALRATDKRDLRRLALPAAAIGPDNDEAIYSTAARVVALGGRIVVAWGADVGPRRRRPAEVAAIVREAAPGAELLALRTCANGQPSHPLMLSYVNQPVPWTPPAVT